MFLTCFMYAQVFTSVVKKAERKVSRIKQVVGGGGVGGSKYIHNNDSHIVCSGYVC